MSKYQWISILGLWAGVFPFLGFPVEWTRWMAAVTGFVIILVAYRGSVAARLSNSHPAPASTDSTFVENKENR